MAGISIATLTGENGILTKATTAKEETRGGAVEEAKNLWKANQSADSYDENTTAQSLDELLKDLKQQKQLTDEEVTTIKETGKVTIGSREIEFFKEVEKTDAYVLVAKGTDKLEIQFIENTLLKNYINKKMENLTDEELYAKAISIPTGEEKTFKELVEELYASGEIKEKHETLRELLFVEIEGMTEEYYNSLLENSKEIIGEKIISDAEITIIHPDGTQHDYWESYQIPIEEKDYTFTIKIAEEEEKVKISIGQYEIIQNYAEEDKGYLLDVKNRKYLKINHSKIDLYGNTIDVDKYLQVEEEYNYLNLGQVYNEIIENYPTNANQKTRARARVYCKTTFECNEGSIEGYLSY